VELHLFCKNMAAKFIQASRSGKSAPGCNGCKFDWLDQTTFSKPFENAIVVSVFLVAPPILDMLPPMKTFIDLAWGKGVKRFVLLSASGSQAGGFAMDQVQSVSA
jgi:festuclavine dehydrogenase